MSPDVEEIVALARRSGVPAEVATALAEEALPALLLPTRAGEAAVGASKLGGLPDLPPGTAWPAASRPMMFCGQLRTEDLAPLHGHEGWRPDPALLSFFADRDPETDEIGACAVLALPLAGLERRPAPEDLDELSRLDGAPVGVQLATTVPDLATHGHRWDYDGLEHYDVVGPFSDALARLYGWPGVGLYARHQFLGHPKGGDEPGDGLRLLLCVGPDRRLDLEIMDGGSVGFFIAPDDLRAGRYDAVTAQELDVG